MNNDQDLLAISGKQLKVINILTKNAKIQKNFRSNIVKALILKNGMLAFIALKNGQTYIIDVEKSETYDVNIVNKKNVFDLVLL